MLARLALPTLSLVALACTTLAPIKLEPGADAVRIVETLSTEERASLTALQSLTCELGVNAMRQSANVEACRNQLRNEARKLGATAVLIEPSRQQIGRDRTDERGSVFHCPNCVRLEGVAYK